MTTAILVIDAQNALCEGEYAAHNIALVIQRINEVTEKARAAGAPVIFIQHNNASILRLGTLGWQLSSGLKVEPADLKVDKTASDSFHKTHLKQVLDDVKATHLVVCGLQTEFCVDTTVRRALALGYPVTLVADGHSTQDNAVLSAQQIIEHHNATLPNITSFGPSVLAYPASKVNFDS